jgi:UDP:flavonoid glycosyltransferase YjiC (YdhE family)
LKIIVATIGSRGDVQPYVNLCQGLQDAGHDVILATNPTLCPLAVSHGVKSAPVGPAVDMGTEGARLMAASFNNMWIGMIRVMQLGARLVEEAYPDVLEVCEGADLVITSDTGSGIAEAEKLGLPWISVTLQPGRIPVDNPNPSVVERVIWGVLGKFLVLPINRSRRRVGAPLVTDITSMLSRRMILLPVSRHVAPPDPRWPQHIHPTGYWFARPLAEWSPPQDLLDFFEEGEKPIAVSLGVMSMSGKQAREGAHIVLQAIRRAGVRAIVQGWDEPLRGVEIPRTVYHAGPMPHSWLFGQVSAIVYHGGFGTTAAALRAGVPGIVIPHVIDQFYWGQRVFELGVGPRFISRGRLSVENLRKAIVQALGDVGLREKAAELGNRIRAEPDGVATAVSIIEKLEP